MKFSSTIYLAILASTVVGKNVIDLEKFRIDVGSEGKNKREAEAAPKNVFPGIKIDRLIDREDSVEKREAKNVFKFDFDHDLDSKKRDESTQIILNNNNNLLQSVIPQVSEISIFGGYIRDNAEISKLTETDTVSTLIIAPSDDAIYNKLQGVKPWEFPELIDESKDDAYNDKVINRNLNSFLNSHIISNFGDLNDGTSKAINAFAISSHLNNGKEITITQDVTTGSFTLTFEEKTIPVASVREVDNGYLFVINDILSKP